MDFLNYEKLQPFIEQYFPGPDNRRARLVGAKREYDSGYYDITRFFGPDRTDPSRITIDYHPEPFKLTNPRIEAFARIIEADLRQQGRIYDGPKIANLVNLDLESDPSVMTLQRASYGDHCGSCLAMDLPHPLFKKTTGTLRSYYRTQPEGPNLLASCLGICGFVLVDRPEPNRVLRVIRSANLATLTGTESPSAAGTVDYTESYVNLEQMIEHSFGIELTEELGLQPDEFEIIPLAIAREIFRGERPQIFCAVRTSLDETELTERLNAIPDSDREFSAYSFTGVDAPHGELNHEGRMNLELVREWLSVQ